MYLAIAAHSEIGLVRKNNQDSGYISPTMLLVCDGMGGAAAGDLASAVATQTLADYDGSHTGEAMLDVLSAGLDEASDMILDLVSDNPDLKGMGTTVCGGFFDGSQLGIIHIGDSRGYRFRDGELTRLTHDHSWVQSLIDGGKITETEAAIHPHRSLLLKVLNGSPQHTPDLMLLDTEPGDRYLFCSDGLSGMIDDAKIAALLDGENLHDVVDLLTEAAHQGGGLDNITIVLGEIQVEEPSNPTAPTLLGAAAEVTVPALSADVEEPATLEIAPAPAPAPAPSSIATNQRKRHLLRWLILTVAFITALVGGAFATRAYLRTQFYIGEHDGKVAIYKGAPDSIGPVPLHILVDDSLTIPLANLPTSYADKVTRHEWQGETVSQVYETVAQLDVLASQCVAQRQKRAADPQSGPPIDGC